MNYVPRHSTDPSADDIRCRELVDLVTEYLEGTLPAEQCKPFEEHLTTCPGCRIYLDQMRQTISMLEHLRQDPISEETQQHLVELFRNWNAGRTA